MTQYPPLTARLAGPAGRLAAVVVMALLVLVTLPAPRAGAATAAPAGLKATTATPTTVSLSWSAVAKAPQYRVAIATQSSMAGAVFHRYTATRAQVQGLKPSSTYYVKVRVITASGATVSPYSKAIVVKTKPRAVSPASVAEPLRVASYNIKCANCHDGVPNEGTWAERRSAVVSTIKGEDLDVVGIQEASQGWLKDSSGKSIDLSQFEDLQQRLGSPWKVTNDKRNNCVKSTTPTNCVYKDQGASQGTRIFYNSSRVDLVDSGSKLLPSLDAANSRYLAWAILRQRSTGLRFFFADSHLEVSKSAYELRKSEAETAVKTIKARNTDNLPVIAVGDFNSSRFADPSNAPYDVYRAAGFTDPIGNAAKSTYAVDPTAERTSQTWLNSFNGFARQAKGNRAYENGSYIDYMLTTPMRVSEWETVARLDSDDKFIGTIPSDHNMIRMTVHLPR